MPRIVYRDDLRFPWVIVYGYDREYRQYQTRYGAEVALLRLLDVIGAAFWAKRENE